MTYKQISSYFNDELKMTTIRDKKFSSSIVWSIEKKMKDRMNRLTRVYYPKVKDVEFTFEDDYDIKISKKK